MSRSDKKGNQSPQLTERARTPAGDSAKQKIPEAEASGNLLEVTTRFELVDEGFADPCLTTWPRHHIGSDEYHSNGAADEARTRYLHLGKVALYQMSYGRILETLLGLLTGASDRNRTNDTGIFSPLLYRLSYRGAPDDDYYT